MTRPCALVCLFILLATSCTSASDPTLRATTTPTTAGIDSEILPSSTTTALANPAAASTTTSTLSGATLSMVGVVEVPVHTAPLVDGTMEEGEWAAAAVVNMDDGTEVRFLGSGGYVYVGIRADQVGSANLLILEGEVVRVLHSSAALGSARYEQEGQAWRLVDDFSWCCRSVDDLSGRSRLLEQEGWQANIGFAGAEGHVEFQAAVDDGPLIALSYVLADGTVSMWPPDLDETARQQLFGARQAVERFSIDQWVLMQTRSDD